MLARAYTSSLPKPQKESPPETTVGPQEPRRKHPSHLLRTFPESRGRAVGIILLCLSLYQTRRIFSGVQLKFQLHASGQVDVCLLGQKQQSVQSRAKVLRHMLPGYHQTSNMNTSVHPPQKSSTCAEQHVSTLKESSRQSASVGMDTRLRRGSSSHESLHQLGNHLHVRVPSLHRPKTHLSP